MQLSLLAESPTTGFRMIQQHATVPVTDGGIHPVFEEGAWPLLAYSVARRLADAEDAACESGVLGGHSGQLPSDRTLEFALEADEAGAPCELLPGGGRDVTVEAEGLDDVANGWARTALVDVESVVVIDGTYGRIEDGAFQLTFPAADVVARRAGLGRRDTRPDHADERRRLNGRLRGVLVGCLSRPATVRT